MSLGDALRPLFAGNQERGYRLAIRSLVHECGHFLDIGLSFSHHDVYYVTEQLTIGCDQGDTISRRGRTFARSRINDDNYSSMRPPCNGSSSRNCDSYADIYLNGDPDDSTFDSGDQGFNLLLEEAFQYVNSLATNYAFNDRYSGSISGKDGLLTHLWWVMRYLKYARNNYPSTHSFLLGDACWREAILTLWGRAWLYLDLTANMGNLGINDAALSALVDDPSLLSEIEAVRRAEGCP